MTHFSSIKLLLLRLLCHVTAFRCKLKGVKMGKQCMINGMPYLRLKKGSSLILGNSVTLLSNPRHNPLISQRMNLQTLTPTAVIQLADHVGISGSRIVACNSVSIGEYTIIGPDTLIYDSEGHHFSQQTGWQSRHSRTGSPITIGARCYIGTRCIILSGVTIGDNCVISAGSVVTQSIPAGHKASGNPASFSPLPKILGGPGKIKHNSHPTP